MKFNHQKMHRDIVVRLASINKSQEYIAKKMGIGRTTIWRLSYGKEIKPSTFLKIVEWLDKPIENYIIK